MELLCLFPARLHKQMAFVEFMPNHALTYTLHGFSGNQLPKTLTMLPDITT